MIQGGGGSPLCHPGCLSREPILCGPQEVTWRGEKEKKKSSSYNSGTNINVRAE